jgi:general secretion pathway protein L
VIVAIFPPAHADPIGADTPFDWVLAGTAGEVLRTGTDTLSHIPRAKRTCLALPACRVLFTELALPPVSSAKLAALLPFAVEDKLMSDPATIHAVAAPTRSAAESIVAVVDKRWLQGMLDALAMHDIFPDQALPESELLQRDAQCWMVVLRDREGFFVRDDGFAVAFDCGDAHEPPLALTLALKEAAQSKRALPQRVRVTSPDTSTGLAAWPEKLGMTVEVVARPAPRERIAGLGVVRPLDFLIGPFAKKSGWTVHVPLLRPALVLAALVLGVHVAFSAIDWWKLERERRSIESVMTAAFKSAFPDARAIVDPALQMRRNLDTLRRERGLGSDSEFQIALARAAAALSGSAVRIGEVRWNGEQLALDLEAERDDAFVPLASRLVASGVKTGVVEKRAGKAHLQVRIDK